MVMRNTPRQTQDTALKAALECLRVAPTKKYEGPPALYFELLPRFEDVGPNQVERAKFHACYDLLETYFKKNERILRAAVYGGRKPDNPAEPIGEEEKNTYKACLVAGLWLGGEVVCAACCRVNMPPKGGTANACLHAQVLFIATRPNLWRHGLAQLLISCIWQQASDAGHRAMSVVVSGPGSRDFWKYLGFMNPRGADNAIRGVLYAVAQQGEPYRMLCEVYAAVMPSQDKLAAKMDEAVVKVRERLQRQQRGPGPSAPSTGSFTSEGSTDGDEVMSQDESEDALVPMRGGGEARAAAVLKEEQEVGDSAAAAASVQAAPARCRRRQPGLLGAAGDLATLSRLSEGAGEDDSDSDYITEDDDGGRVGLLGARHRRGRGRTITAAGRSSCPGGTGSTQPALGGAPPAATSAQPAGPADGASGTLAQRQQAAAESSRPQLKRSRGCGLDSSPDEHGCSTVPAGCGPAPGSSGLQPGTADFGQPPAMKFYPIFYGKSPGKSWSVDKTATNAQDTGEAPGSSVLPAHNWPDGDPWVSGTAADRRRQQGQPMGLGGDDPGGQRPRQRRRRLKAPSQPVGPSPGKDRVQHAAGSGTGRVPADAAAVLQPSPVAAARVPAGAGACEAARGSRPACANAAAAGPSPAANGTGIALGLRQLEETHRNFVDQYLSNHISDPRVAQYILDMDLLLQDHARCLGLRPQ